MYLDSIQSLLHDHTATIPPDTDISDQGWMTTDILSRLKMYSPKLVQLLTGVQSDLNQRHVIFSRLNDRGGLRAIQTLLSYLHIESVMIIDTDSLEDNLIKIS